MNIRQLRTNETGKANYLIADFAKDVTAGSKRVVDTEKYRHFSTTLSVGFLFSLTCCP